MSIFFLSHLHVCLGTKEETLEVVVSEKNDHLQVLNWSSAVPPTNNACPQIHQSLDLLAGLFPAKRNISIPPLIGTQCHNNHKLDSLAAIPRFTSFSSCLHESFQQTAKSHFLHCLELDVTFWPKIAPNHADGYNCLVPTRDLTM